MPPENLLFSGEYYIFAIMKNIINNKLSALIVPMWRMYGIDTFPSITREVDICVGIHVGGHVDDILFFFAGLPTNLK